MLRLPFDLSGLPQGDDVSGMRRWVQEVFSSKGYNEEKARFQSKYQQRANRVTKSVIPVPISAGSDECFDLWIYEPLSDEKNSRIKLRPAIFMFHGGGWIHGSPIGDEGE